MKNDQMDKCKIKIKRKERKIYEEINKWKIINQINEK